MPTRPVSTARSASCSTPRSSPADAASLRLNSSWTLHHAARPRRARHRTRVPCRTRRGCPYQVLPPVVRLGAGRRGRTADRLGMARRARQRLRNARARRRRGTSPRRGHAVRRGRRASIRRAAPDAVPSRLGGVQIALHPRPYPPRHRAGGRRPRDRWLTGPRHGTSPTYDCSPGASARMSSSPAPYISTRALIPGPLLA